MTKKNLTALCLCPRVLWKAKFISDDLGYLAKEISKQNIEGTVWVILNLYTVRFRSNGNDLEVDNKEKSRVYKFGKVTAYLYQEEKK